MSGVNAHALVHAPSLTSTAAATTTAVPWRKSLTTPVEPLHPFISSFLNTWDQGRSSYGIVAQFDINLSTARLAYLQDHIVSGRALLPATAFLEIFHAAVNTLGGFSSGEKEVSASGVAIHAPCMLSLQQSGSGGGQLLSCTVNREGVLAVSSAKGADAKHLTAQCTFLYSVTETAAFSKLDQPSSSAGVGVIKRVLNDDSNSSSEVPKRFSLAALGSTTTEVSEYISHPASLDASLHLGAVKPAELLSSSTSKVPVGLGATAFFKSIGAQHAQQAFTLAECSDLTPDDAITDTYSEGSGWKCSLVGLKAKAISKPGATTHTKTKGVSAASPAEEEFTYELIWQTAQPFKGPSISSCVSINQSIGAHIESTVDGLSLRSSLAAGGDSNNSARLASTGVAALQGLLALHGQQTETAAHGIDASARFDRSLERVNAQ